MTPKRGREFYKLTQMVFQDPYGSLHPRQTVNTALMEPIKIHRLDNLEDRILKAMSDVGLGPPFRFRFPHQLLGGQRQRAAIARALVLEPKLLLLDEPTSALDVSVQAEILNLFRELYRNLGLTYILVTHDLSVISHLCDRIAVMNYGKILEQLDVQGLTNNTPRPRNFSRRARATIDVLANRWTTSQPIQPNRNAASIDDEADGIITSGVWLTGPSEQKIVANQSSVIDGGLAHL